MNSLDSQLDTFAGEAVDAETGELEPLPEYRPINSRPLPMPAELAKAIIAIKGKVKSLAKEDENRFANFKYTSVDTFYGAIGPLMAAAGLLLVTDEVEVTTIERPKATWLRIRYELMLYHESGAGYGPIHRMIMVQATGAQAFGAAISYVEKYYLRGLFRVPTGEPDMDADKPEDLPAQIISQPALAKHVGAFSKNQEPPEPPAKARSKASVARPAPRLSPGASPGREQGPPAATDLEETAREQAKNGHVALKDWYQNVLTKAQREALKRPDENGQPSSGWLVKLAYEADRLRHGQMT